MPLVGGFASAARTCTIPIMGQHRASQALGVGKGQLTTCCDSGSQARITVTDEAPNLPAMGSAVDTTLRMDESSQRGSLASCPVPRASPF
ncbi:hypothetical protein GGTG_03619 [Gaeumannomyces tritici R3-111a-1]|uniref:Uncharacterized protein n=1 Tax=Gaeumannomyces tritici (strain R3-111a-1) TaxID=644352 RepID=J3NQR3_GAET3|nr:hypothetical protein GGTG_03619 [Gaeumannomyces tritici R3-111a-1]EJT78519.1 hypothetical protein GGTG_03619 [Gaeumannomyces tritici R3-111a-1]